ncbi:MAG: hypothetical protein AB1473_19565 [Thermodesulfobacteriota bacterium]
MRTGIIVVVTLLIFGAAVENLYAYTYTYNNRTIYLIRISVQLYDDPGGTGRIEVSKSYSISSKSLLKSWTAEAFVDNSWQQILNFTCDFLPGDHTFSIYVNEAKDANGKASRTWHATSE